MGQDINGETFFFFFFDKWRDIAQIKFTLRHYYNYFVLYLNQSFFRWLYDKVLFFSHHENVYIWIYEINYTKKNNFF